MKTHSHPGGRALALIASCALLAAALVGCSPRAAVSNHQLRLRVGEVREIAVPRPADTSLRLQASTDNPEVADVSPHPAPVGEPQSGEKPGWLKFLVKGVTAGKVRVVFSEKTNGLEVRDRVAQIYLVEVVNP